MKKSPPLKKLPDIPGSTDRTEIELLRQKITELVIKTPTKAATVLSEWIKRPSKRGKKSA